MDIHLIEHLDWLHVVLYASGMVAALYSMTLSDDPLWFKVVGIVAWPLLAGVVIAAGIAIGVRRAWRYQRRFPGSFPFRPRLWGWPARVGIRAYRARDREHMAVDVVQMRRYEEEWYVTVAGCRWINGWPGFIGDVDRVYSEHGQMQAIRDARAFADRNGLPYGKSLTEHRE